MGILLEISATARRRPPNRLPKTGESAEIVMFPGVRIERQTVDLGARIRKVGKETGSKVRPDA